MRKLLTPKMKIFLKQIYKINKTFYQNFNAFLTFIFLTIHTDLLSFVYYFFYSNLRSLIKKYPDKCCTGSNRRKMQTPFDNANLETLEFLLQLKKEENIPINQIADQDGNSLMHKAIIYNQFEVVRYLLANYPSLVSLKNCYGIYPIHLCVLRGNMEILRLICRESKKFINKR